MALLSPKANRAKTMIKANSTTDELESQSQSSKPARIRKGGRFVRLLPLERLAYLTIILAIVLTFTASCSDYDIYAPSGPIAKRVHDINGMCIAYLFEDGGPMINENYDKYAPQLINMLNSEAATLEAIHKKPSSKYTAADLDVIEAAAKEMRELSGDIQIVLDDLNSGKDRTECGSPWYEWMLLDHISKYIDDPHTHSGSKALYE